MIRGPEKNLGIEVGALMKMVTKTEASGDHDFSEREREREKKIQMGAFAVS